MRYAAVIFDIIESRRYSDRYEVQNILLVPLYTFL